MQIDHQRPGSMASRARDVFLRIVAIIVGAALLVGAFILSLVLFAVIFAIVLVVGGYLWWKTRDLRRQMRARFEQRDVIEGTATEVQETDGTPR